MSDLIQATGLWFSTNPDSKLVASGNLGGARVLIFKNNNKKGDRSPDLFLCFGEQREKENPRTAKVTEGDDVIPF
jgi:hypothetical protein